ncbi:hypothetical protein D3C80_1988650 [compost metagenome]
MILGMTLDSGAQRVRMTMVALLPQLEMSVHRMPQAMRSMPARRAAIPPSRSA